MNELDPKQVVEPELAPQEENASAAITSTETEVETTSETPEIQEISAVAKEEIQTAEQENSQTETSQEKEVEPEPEPETEITVEAETEKEIEIEPVAETEVETESENETVETDEKSVSSKSDLPDFDIFTPMQLVEYLQAIVNEDVTEVKSKVELIKQTFYRKLNAAATAARQQFVADGGKEEEFKMEKDENEERLKQLLNEYRQKKAKYNEQQDRDRENNLLQKQHILQQMRAFIESTDDVSTFIAEFKNLQQKWKTIGQIPSTHNTEIWKQYGRLQEQFWDLVKLNNEFRELDFRKNLEAKILLCEAAERLADEENVVSAFQTLQKLHDEWHELGPVQRELREEIWTRFKDASALVNKKHQSYFETVRKDENDNLARKTELCEKAEGFDFSGFKSYDDWDEGTNVIISLQNEWKKIGFASRKYNQKIFDRFRKACDAFFSAKAAYYKDEKAVLQKNLEKKIALCEKAEALKDSTEWKETGEKIMELQKEWKSIGRVVRKHSDIVWKRFIAACDYFFEQKAKNSSGQHKTELENLEKKRAIIAQLEKFEYSASANETVEKLKELIAEWNEIGHVPYRDKEKIYKSFREAVNRHFDALHVDQSSRRLESFRKNLQDISKQGGDKIYHERERMVRAFERLKQEIATYENNLGFLTKSSKKGSSIIQEMEKKLASLKDERNLLEQKIKMLEENI